MPAIRLTINSQRWTVKFVRKITNGGDPCDGICDYERKEIRVDRTLAGKELLDTVIHEVLHAAGFNLNEEFVGQTASDIAEALTHPEIRGRI